MLCVNSYPREFVDRCRAQVEGQVAAYRDLVGRVGSGDPAVLAFEPLHFNSLVVVLDRCFVHRSRTLERKDGNPMNEVRMFCNSLLENHGVLASDKSIKYRPDRAVLKLEFGQEIRLTETDFLALFEAYFKEIEATFVS